MKQNLQAWKLKWWYEFKTEAKKKGEKKRGNYADEYGHMGPHGNDLKMGPSHEIIELNSDKAESFADAAYL